MCIYLMANNEKAERYLKSPITRMILNGGHQGTGYVFLVNIGVSNKALSCEWFESD